MRYDLVIFARDDKSLRNQGLFSATRWEFFIAILTSYLELIRVYSFGRSERARTAYKNQLVLECQNLVKLADSVNL